MVEYTHHIPPECHEAVEVLFFDDDILVVSKPSGLLSVPGRIVKDSVINRMMVDFPDLRAVHRLDLDTSGLLVFGISQLAVSELNRQFRERTVLKEYVAEVDGVIADDIGEIDLPISADWENRPRQRIDNESGKDAQTYYEVMSRRDDATRLRLKPKTGRSHQLRIHLAEIGHPILGCDLYAHERALSRSPRLCLHAEILGFEHPRSKERLSYTSPTPF